MEEEVKQNVLVSERFNSQNVDDTDITNNIDNIDNDAATVTSQTESIIDGEVSEETSLESPEEPLEEDTEAVANTTVDDEPQSEKPEIDTREEDEDEDEDTSTSFDFLDLTGDSFFDSTGNPVEKQLHDGKMKATKISLDEIDIPPRGKIFDIDVSTLEESINMWGVIEPLHVIPYKNKINEDRYILVHGYRRYLACSSLGMLSVPAIVDTTRPKEIVRYLEVIVNNVKKYNFIEMMRIGEYIEQRQKGFSHETIENILGLPSGAYLKAKYIESAKDDFEEIYEKVVKEKMTIDAAFRKIEKELNNGNAGGSALENLNKNGLDTGYDTVDDTPNVQKKGERTPLDPALRKEVERRDNYTCQSCGNGRDNVAYSSIFHAHHMIPVKHHGPDSDRNLIMLCPNCHGYVHGIDEGRFKPKKSMVDDNPVMQNIVILANIVKKGLPQGCTEEPYDFFIKQARQPWLSEEALAKREEYENLRQVQLENEKTDVVPNGGFADESDSTLENDTEIESDSTIENDSTTSSDGQLE